VTPALSAAASLLLRSASHGAAALTELLAVARRQLAVLLPRDPSARRAFMTGGYLQRVQEIKLSAPPKVAEAIARITACFPDEAVRFSDPAYARELLSRMDEGASA
jgi:hypothetical protein